MREWWHMLRGRRAAWAAALSLDPPSCRVWFVRRAGENDLLSRQKAAV
jgi:hypothetical protein